MAEKYDGWILRNKWGSLLLHCLKYRRKDVIEQIGADRWKAWKEEGHKIVKVKLVEVK